MQSWLRREVRVHRVLRIACGKEPVHSPFGNAGDVGHGDREGVERNRQRHAVKVAAADERLRGVTVAVAGSDETVLPETQAKFLTLSARTLERQKRSRLELLALLSTASERVGEFEKAADFERARVISLSSNDRRKAEARIEQLKAKQEEKAKKRGVPMMVSEALVASR